MEPEGPKATWQWLDSRTEAQSDEPFDQFRERHRSELSTFALGKMCLGEDLTIPRSLDWDVEIQRRQGTFVGHPKLDALGRSKTGADHSEDKTLSDSADSTERSIRYDGGRVVRQAGRSVISKRDNHRPRTSGFVGGIRKCRDCL